jgi:sulfhydrogenase subunit gamma (sulfur reductase)
MTDTAYSDVPLIEAWDETETLRALKFKLPSGYATEHRVPGQVVKVRTSAGEGYFALSSAPGAPEAELLVKRGAPAADLIAATEPGKPLAVSTPFGRGFPVEHGEGRDLLIFAVGSGITPVRSLVRHIGAARARFGRVVVFYGQRAAGEFAYGREHDAWAQSGMTVVLCASRASDESATLLRGYVQDVAERRDYFGVDRARAVAYLCGHKAMVAGVRETLARAGIPADRTYLNY